MTRIRLAPLLVPLLLAGVAGADDGDLAEDPAAGVAPPPPLHLVRAAELTTGSVRDGVVRADVGRRVVLRVEGDVGRLEVAAVGTALEAGGRVAKGDVLLVARAPDLADALRAAREAAEAARAEVAALEAEDAQAAAAAKAALEQAEAAARDAARALERFQAHDGPMALEDAALDEAQATNGVADQREELAQLEQLYKGTQLAPDTKEIVLERARRDAQLAERRLALARTRRLLHDQWEHPDRLRALQEAARWTRDGATRLRDEQGAAAARRAQGLTAARRALRDAEERAARLGGDAERLVLTAPVDGVVAAAGLQPGDPLAAGQVVATVHDAARLVVALEATEDDLRHLAPGKPVRVGLPAYAEVSLSGVVREVSPVASPGEGEPTWTCVVALEGGSPRLRLGVRARVEVTGEVVRRALCVPRRAVEARDGRTYVRVWVSDHAQELEVVLGPGDRDRVQVLSGLVAGDRVVLPARP